MAKKVVPATRQTTINAQPRIHQRAVKFKRTARFLTVCRSNWMNRFVWK